MTLFGAKIFEAIGNMFKFGSAAKLTGKEIKELGKSFAEASAKEIAQLDKLFENLDKTREGTAEWYDARAQILSQHGDILSAMGSEISSLNDKAGAYRVLRDEIYKTAKAEAVTKATQELQTKAIETAVQGYAKIYDEAVIKKGQKFADEFIKRVRNDIETTGKLSDELSKEIEQLFPMQFERVIGTGTAGNIMKTNAAPNTVPITIKNILKAENDLIKKRNEA
jgi:DNA repair ATPase RecN